MTDSEGMNENCIIRKTVSMCPICLAKLPATVEVAEGGVYLIKKCPQCGESRVRLSKHAWYYAELDRYFFGVMKEKLIQRDYIIRLTEKCNLNCPICLASANDNTEPDLPLDDLLKFADKNRRLKIDLMAAEPTLREDLPEMVKKLKEKGHIVALHTNGLKIADRDYLKTLVDAGIDEVHLQMDGFEDKTYIALRGRKLTGIKMQALKNLEEFNIATDLVMVISPGLNEHEVPAMFEYARKHSFIRELFFLGLRSLGKARESGHDECYTPDDTIDIIEKQTGGEIGRKSVLRFQKLYFALLSCLGIRKCLYVQHYLSLRDNKKGFIHAEDWCDWDKVEKHLDKLVDIPGRSVFPKLWWFFNLCLKMFSINTVRVAWDIVKMRIWSGFDLSSMAGRTLILGFITACDPYIYDDMIADYCGKGEVAADIGIHQSGSRANVDREVYWKLREQGMEKEEAVRTAFSE